MFQGKQPAASWSIDVGAHQFEELCDRFADSSPAFIAELRKERDHYRAFLKYPKLIRRSLSTTNAVEAINGPLEIVRRNSGGSGALGAAALDHSRKRQVGTDIPRQQVGEAAAGDERQ